VRGRSGGSVYSSPRARAHLHIHTHTRTHTHEHTYIHVQVHTVEEVGAMLGCVGEVVAEYTDLLERHHDSTQQVLWCVAVCCSALQCVAVM